MIESLFNSLLLLNKIIVLPELIDGEQPGYFLSNDPNLHLQIYMVDGKAIKLARCDHFQDGYEYMYIPFEYRPTETDILQSKLDYLSMMVGIELP